MDHRAALILAASFFSGGAHAAYATLSAPAGWAQGAGAVATYNTAKTAAQVASVELGRIAANAALTVNGKSIPVPARLPLGPGAARVAAAAIYLHPGLRAIAAVAAWTGAAKLVYDVSTGLWGQPDPNAVVSDGYIWKLGDIEGNSPHELCNLRSYWPSSAVSVELMTYSSTVVNCRFTLTTGHKSDAYGVTRAGKSNCPAGWYFTPAGCAQNRPHKPVTKEEFEQMVPDARPMPPDLPGVVWPASWPVEVPEIQPMFIPTGNPVKNPAYDPAKPTSPDNQPWLQPGVKLSPAPTPSSPWNVDLQPVNRPVDNPNPSPDPVVDPVPNPDGSGDTDKPRDPEKDQRDLCEKYPEILACQKMDEPEDPGELKTKAVDLDFQVQGGYAGAAVCPAPMTYQAFDRVLTLSWQPFCDSLAMVKNLLLAFAWISAAFILLGAKKE